AHDLERPARGSAARRLAGRGARRGGCSMNSNATLTPPVRVAAAGTSAAEIEAAAARAARRRVQTVYFWRYLILVVFLGGWEVLVRAKVMDEFFFSKPSDIVGRLWTWITEGTSEGSLWYHLWVTMEESMLGFVTGAVAGIVAGIALGRNRMMADVFS